MNRPHANALIFRAGLEHDRACLEAVSIHIGDIIRGNLLDRAQR